MGLFKWYDDGAVATAKYAPTHALLKRMAGLNGTDVHLWMSELVDMKAHTDFAMACTLRTQRTQRICGEQQLVRRCHV